MASGESRIFFRRFTGKRPAAWAVAALLGALLVLSGAPGCGSSEPATKTSTGTSTTIARERLDIGFYKGIVEPRQDDWQGLFLDAERLKGDGFNIVTLEPPVLITQRAGGKPRVILEGAAITVPGMIDDFHEKGLATHIAPTTASPGFTEAVTPDETTIERLTEDAVEWAQKAEERQAELFSPLSRCNLVLGTDASRQWLQEVLPRIRDEFSGPIAAKVAADIDTPVLPGAVHDFERLDYRGYDYLMVDIHPWGSEYDESTFESYAAEVLARAAMVVERDGLKGFIIGDLRLRSEEQVPGSPEVPVLDEQEQADAAGMFLEMAMPKVSGIFYYGWSLAGEGARERLVEEILSRYFGAAPDATS